MKRLLMPALVAGAMAVAGCGSDDDSSSSGEVRGNATDRAFVAEMIPHHESAVEMAKIAEDRGESEFVRKLAKDIISAQNVEIGTMRQEDEALDTAGVKRGSLPVPDHMKGMDDDPAMLRKAEPFDKAFIEMMIPHHEGAIAMAKAEIKDGKDPELKGLAQDIVSAQEREIKEMREHLGSDAAEQQR